MLPTSARLLRLRSVEPARLVHTGRWYLVAFDREREAWRTFRVDRVAPGPTLGEPLAPRLAPEGGDLRRYVSRALAVDSLTGVGAWVASFEVDFEVLEPPELVDVLRDLHLRIDRALATAGR